MNGSVGVVIPTYNCARYVGVAIDSVLGQTMSVDRVVVVDDGSTDDTQRELRKYKGRIEHLYQQNAGIGAARNAGVEILDTEYLAFLDADDFWMLDKIEAQMGSIQNHAADAIFGGVIEFREGEGHAPWSAPNSADHNKSGAYTACTMLIRRDSFLRVGCFRTDTTLAEFVDWFSRFREAGLSEISLQRPVLYRRIHSGNTGVRNRSQRNDYHRILKAVLDRRRGL